MASGGSNQFMQELYDQFLACKICYETYKQPKTLSCLHTFCCYCLEQHVDSERERSSYRYMVYSRAVSCPICRKKTELPSGGVRRLPDNFLVGNLSDMVSRRKPTKAPFCEICFGSRNTCNEACVKCLDCTKLLCKECVELHRKTKVTSSHSLCDIDVEKDIECKIHKDEPVRFYCEPCEVCVCVVCTFQEHKGHDVSSFKEGISKYRGSLEELVSTCKTRVNQLKEQLDLINNCEKSMKLAEAQIRDMSASMMTAIRGKERQLLEELREFYGTDTTTFLEKKDNLQDTYENLKTTSNLTEIILRDKGVELLLLRRDIEEKIKALLDPTLETPPVKIEAPVKFVPGLIKFGTLDTRAGHSDEHDESDMETSSGVDEEHPSSEEDEDMQDEMTPVEVNETSTQTEISLKELAKLLAVESVDSKCQTDRVDTMDVGISAKTVITVGRCINTINPDYRERETMTDIKHTIPKRIQTDRVMLFTTGMMTEKPRNATKGSNTSATETSDVGMFTDPVPTENKKTLTNKILMVNKDTNTTLELLSEKPVERRNVYTETFIPTADKSVCTIEVITKDAISATTAIKVMDAGTDRPIFQSHNKGTTTPHILLSSKGVQITPEPPKLHSVGTGMPSHMVNGNKANHIEVVETGTEKPQFPSNDMGTSTPIIDHRERGTITEFAPRPMLVSKETDVPQFPSNDKETSMPFTQTVERSTETKRLSFVDTCTDKPQFPSIDACTCTPTITTKDSKMETEKVVMISKATEQPRFLMIDRGTGMAQIQQKDQQTETLVINETDGYVDAKPVSGKDKEQPILLSTSEKSVSTPRMETTSTACDPIISDIQAHILDGNSLCCNCKNTFNNELNTSVKDQLKMPSIEQGCDPIIMDYLDTFNEAELQALMDKMKAVARKSMVDQSTTTGHSVLTHEIGTSRPRLSTMLSMYSKSTEQLDSIAGSGMVSQGTSTYEDNGFPTPSKCMVDTGSFAYSTPTDSVGVNTMLKELSDKSSNTICNLTKEEGTNTIKLLLQDTATGMKHIEVVSTGVGDGTTNVIHRASSPIPVLSIEQGTNTSSVKTSEKNVGTKVIKTTNSATSIHVSHVNKGICTDPEPVPTPIKTHDVGVLATCSMVNKKTGRHVKTTEVSTHTSVTSRNQGTVTHQPMMTDRASSAYKTPSNDKLINTEPIAVRDKQTGTAVVNTKESTTCMGSVIRKDAGIGTTKVQTIEKETTTTRILTMNKNVATINTASVDKCTITKSPVHIDAYTMTRPVRIYDKGKLAPIKRDNKETMTTVQTTESATETRRITMASKSTMAIRGAVKVNTVDRCTSTTSDELSGKDEKPVGTSNDIAASGKSSAREVYFPAHLKKTSIFSENALDDLQDIIRIDACVGTDDMIVPRKCMKESATNTENCSDGQNYHRSMSEADADQVVRISPTDRLWTSAFMLDRDSGRTAFVPRSKHREMTVVCKVEESTMTSEIPTENRGTMTGTSMQSKSVETDPVPTGGRISECISKLRHVTQRLESGGASSSPTQTNAPVTTLTSGLDMSGNGQSGLVPKPTLDKQPSKSTQNAPTLENTSNMLASFDNTSIQEKLLLKPLKPLPPVKPLQRIPLPKSLQTLQTQKPAIAPKPSFIASMPLAPPKTKIPPTTHKRPSLPSVYAPSSCQISNPIQLQVRASGTQQLPSQGVDKNDPLPILKPLLKDRKLTLPQTSSQKTETQMEPDNGNGLRQQPVIKLAESGDVNTPTIKQHETEEKKKEKHRRKRLDIKQLLATGSSRESIEDVSGNSKMEPKVVQPTQYHKITKFFKQFKPKKDKETSEKATPRQDEEARTPVAKRRLLSDFGRQKLHEKENIQEQTTVVKGNSQVEDWFQATPGSVRRHLMNLAEENTGSRIASSSAVDPADESPLIRRRLQPAKELVLEGPAVTAKVEHGQTLTPSVKRRTETEQRSPLQSLPPDSPPPRRKLIKPHPKDRSFNLSDSSDSSSNELPSANSRPRRRVVLDGSKKERKQRQTTMTPKLRRKLLPDLTKKQLLNPSPFLAALPMSTAEEHLYKENVDRQTVECHRPPMDDENSSDIADSSSFHSCFSESNLDSRSNSRSGSGSSLPQQEPVQISNDLSPEVIVLESPPSHVITAPLTMSFPAQVTLQAPTEHPILYEMPGRSTSYQPLSTKSLRDAFLSPNNESDNHQTECSQEVFV